MSTCSYPRDSSIHAPHRNSRVFCVELSSWGYLHKLPASLQIADLHVFCNFTQRTNMFRIPTPSRKKKVLRDVVGNMTGQVDLVAQVALARDHLAVFVRPESNPYFCNV